MEGKAKGSDFFTLFTYVNLKEVKGNRDKTFTFFCLLGAIFFQSQIRVE